jgi:hypothetical protein
MKDKELLKALKKNLYTALNDGGFVDKDVFEQEIERYTKIVCEDYTPYEDCLLSLMVALEKAGGDSSIICSEERLNNSTIKEFLELLGSNNIRFYYTKNQKVIEKNVDDVY